jgi:uncharacterized protein YyaL (SSP411 family)
MPNRLANEPSPYLLQHKDNPVDWYPWGAEAFEQAARDEKPIFLSIGYSTCHWCHVMEHESFEDASTAEILNREFVSIKVDREERPDVDRVYMTFVQATTGSGGWPMSVWLTPQRQPFYGGTYFPPASQWGRPGFRDVLTEVARAWKHDRAKVLASAAHIVDRLATIAAGEGSRPASPLAGSSRATARDALERALTATLQQFVQTFDSRRGGFGDAPKFPRPSELLFLLREHARTGSDPARDMVLHTLRSMALGGMRDHIGGGFHRYSVDGNWRVPHFEKMLYDQAQLVLAYLEASQAAAEPFFAQIAEDTLQYVERELTDPAGGFHSAEDADSVPPASAGIAGAHKSEGAFYIWSQDEIRAALGDDGQVFELRYGVQPNGNAPFDPQNEFGANNLLHTARSIADIARETGREPGDVAGALLKARQILFERRAGRPRPHLDDKVLTAWNGLMVAACARASRVLAGGEALDQPIDGGDPGARHLRAAERAAFFLRGKMWDPDRRILFRRYRGGAVAIDGYAEDYACLIFGLLELFQAGGDPQWLEWARDLQGRQDDLFADEEHGGWFSTSGQDSTVLLRMKEDYDGAEPSATSVAALNLLTLSHLTGDTARRGAADRAIASFGARLAEQGRAVPMMAAAAAVALQPGEQIVLVGRLDDPGMAAMRRAVERRYRPFSVVMPVVPGDRQERLSAIAPFVADMKMIDGKATAYVCRDFACDAPVTDPAVLG